MTSPEERYSSLRRFATEIRLNTLETLNHLGFGHYGGSLSIVEALAVLYGDIMDINPEKFKESDRDYMVLSKGHAGPALYSTLYLKVFFDKTFLHSLNTNGTKLPSHPDRNLTPGIDVTTGSLGQGISIATGIAYAQKIENSSYYTYTIVDDNKKQLDGLTADICNPGDFVAKFEAFGFDAVRVKGDDIEAIDKAIKTFQDSNSVRPKCIVLDSIKGQGVKELEELASNHHLRPDLQQKTMLERALISLRESLEVVE